MSVEVERAEGSAKRAGGMFRALSHRNFRLFWAGAFLSNTGTWMQAVAQSWLVYDLTKSPFWLGLDAFMSTAPGLGLTLLAGVFADLVDRRRLLLFTQVGAGLSAVVVAVIVALMMVRYDEKKVNAPAHSMKDSRAVWSDLVEGLRYVRRRRRVFM